MEKYSSGWRGAPAKGVGRLRGARVQIPPSPLKDSANPTVFFISDAKNDGAHLNRSRPNIFSRPNH